MFLNFFTVDIPLKSRTNIYGPCMKYLKTGIGEISQKKIYFNNRLIISKIFYPTYISVSGLY